MRGWLVIAGLVGAVAGCSRSRAKAPRGDAGVLAGAQARDGGRPDAGAPDAALASVTDAAITRLAGLQFREGNGNQLTERLEKALERPGQTSKLDLTSIAARDDDMWEPGTIEVIASETITVLPSEIGELSGLRQLVLQGNALTTLPPQIGRLVKLEELDVSGNQLGQLPVELGRLTGLRRLKLSDNKLQALPDLGALDKLEELDLSDNRLTALPPGIEKLTRLRRLDLGDNPLRELPDAIGKLTGLTDLYLRNANLRALPGSIGGLAQLSRLELAQNPLAALPDSLSTLPLSYLNLNGTALAPPDIEALRAGMPNTKVSYAPPVWQDLASAAQQPELVQHLDLAGRPPASYADLAKLTELRTLSLRKHGLHELPAEVLALPRLERLDLGLNKLASLPALDALRHLRVLDLTGNLLQALPAGVDKLPELERLVLDKNYFTRDEMELIARQLPRVLAGWEFRPKRTRSMKVALEHPDRTFILDLTNQSLYSLPDDIGKLSNLEVLILDYNRLDELPKSLAKLDLVHLSLIGNDFDRRAQRRIRQFMPATTSITFEVETGD